jgi:hypothetical protein
VAKHAVELTARSAVDLDEEVRFGGSLIVRATAKLDPSGNPEGPSNQEAPSNEGEQVKEDEKSNSHGSALSCLEYDLTEASLAILDEDLPSLIDSVLQILLCADAPSEYLGHCSAPPLGESSDHVHNLLGEVDAELHDGSSHTPYIPQRAR